MRIGIGIGIEFNNNVVAVSPPANTVAPAVTGNPAEGQTLTTTDGTWTGSPTFTYQWYKGGVAIGGATANTLVLAFAQVGNTANIKCTVTATNAAGPVSADSNTVAQIFTARTWAYLVVTAISDATIKSNLNTMDIAIRGNAGLNTNLAALYPNKGGNATANKYNFFNPVDTDAGFRTTFAGGVTHNAGDVTYNGTNGYGDTHYIPSVSNASDDMSFGYFAGAHTANGGTSIGCGTGTADCKIYPKLSNNFYWWVNNLVNTNVANADGSGFFGVHREGTSIFGNLRGTETSAVRVQTTVPNVSMIMGASNISGTPSDYSNVVMKSAFIIKGNSTSAMVESLRLILEALN